MSGSWSIGRLAGIEVKIHFTFFFIIFWTALTSWFAHHDVSVMFLNVGFMLSIFSCVLLHEFGHAFAARYYGIRTWDITMLPIGGLARLERLPEKPREEILVAMAGPATNLILALGFYLVRRWSGFETMAGALSEGGSIFVRLILVNVFLACFNLLPAFPMDGGRIVRGLLATRLHYARATRLAANLGQVMAILFAVVGLFFNPMLIFIGAFVWIGAGQEATLVERRFSIRRIRAEDAMQTEYTILSPEDSLEHAIALILAGCHHDFPVIKDGRLVGVLSRKDLSMGLVLHGEGGMVGQVMHRDFKAVEATELLETALPRLQSSPCKIAPVTRFGALVGLLMMEKIEGILSVRNEMAQIRQAA